MLRTENRCLGQKPLRWSAADVCQDPRQGGEAESFARVRELEERDTTWESVGDVGLAYSAFYDGNESEIVCLLASSQAREMLVRRN